MACPPAARDWDILTSPRAHARTSSIASRGRRSRGCTASKRCRTCVAHAAAHRARSRWSEWVSVPPRRIVMNRGSRSVGNITAPPYGDAHDGRQQPSLGHWRSMETPPVRYAKSGDVHIAYQVIGSGAIDLVLIPGLFSNIDNHWDEPGCARFLRRLASFSRLIVVDPRGTGLSDRAQRYPPMEDQVDDILSVLDAVGSRSAAFFVFSQAGPI